MARENDEKKNIPVLRSAEDSGERRTSWAELLNDLAYTAIIMQLATRLTVSLSLESLLEFVLLYVPVWWLWNGQTHYATRFDNADDMVHRLLASAQLIGLFILAASISQATEARSAVYALAYASVRGILLIEYGRAWWYVPQSRPLVRVILAGFSISVLIWISSIWVVAPYRYGLWVLALLIELITPVVAGSALQTKFPPDIRHLPERYGLLTLLVLGQAVTGVVLGLDQSGFRPNAVLAAILGGVLIVGLWWAYFDRLDDDAVRELKKTEGEGKKQGFNKQTESAVWHYTTWLYMHLPLTIALTGCGAALTKAIEQVSQAELSTPVYWLLIGSVVTYLIAEAIISLTTLLAGTRHVTIQRGVWGRFGAGVGLLLLGLLTHMAVVPLLLVMSGVVVGLIVIDQLSPEPPSSTERVKDGMDCL